MFKSLSISSLGSLTASWLDANSRSACSPQHQCPSYRLSIFGQPPPEVEMLAHKNIPGLGLSSASEKKPVALRRWNVHRNCAQHLKAIAWVNTLNQSKIHQNYIHYKRKNIDQFTVKMTSFWVYARENYGKLTWEPENHPICKGKSSSKFQTQKPDMLGFSWICSFASWSSIGICWDFRKAINVDGS